MRVETYSPSDVILTFGGYVLSNWDEIAVETNGPAFKIVRGIRGKSTRVRTMNRSATLTITLPVTSTANAVLDTICQMDQESGNGRIELTLRDVGGTEVFSSADAFVEAPAARRYGKDSQTRTWTVQCMSIVSMTHTDTMGIESLF